MTRRTIVFISIPLEKRSRKPFGPFITHQIQRRAMSARNLPLNDERISLNWNLMRFCTLFDVIYSYEVNLQYSREDQYIHTEDPRRNS
jgi:hypothetical protein